MSKPENNNQVLGINFAINFLIGGVSSGFQKTVFAPVERIQILLQTQNGIKKIQEGKIMKYRGIFNCFYRIYQEEGIRSFWRGNLASVLRYYPPQFLNFYFKDVFKKFLCPFDHKKEKVKFFVGNIMSGAAAGATSLLIVYPLDFARTRLGADIGNKYQRQFTGLWDCLKQIAKIDGPMGLYRGFGITVFGIMVYRGIYFGFYDNAKEMLYPLPIMSSNYAKYFLIQTVTFTAGFISYPIHTVQRRMMMLSGRQDIQRKSTFICIRNIINKEGFTAFYNGYFTNIFRFVGSATFLLMYDTFQEYLIYLKKSSGRD